MITKGLKKIVKWPLRSLLAWKPLRQRVVFELARNYYGDLNIAVPLAPGVLCPISHQEHWVSFDEIFGQDEYADFLSRIPLPRTWIDIGCHAGHFSLLLASMWARKSSAQDWRALLIDADSRSSAAIKSVIKCNNFKPSQMDFVSGAISANKGDVLFSENLFMTSEAGASNNVDGTARRVPGITEQDILSRFGEACDLIKIDIEGGEYDFFTSYKKIINKAKYIIFEWHSWHSGNGGKEQLIKILQDAGFRLLMECNLERVVKRNGKDERCGGVLMEKIDSA